MGGRETAHGMLKQLHYLRIFHHHDFLKFSIFEFLLIFSQHPNYKDNLRIQQKFSSVKQFN